MYFVLKKSESNIILKARGKATEEGGLAMPDQELLEVESRRKMTTSPTSAAVLLYPYKMNQVAYACLRPLFENQEQVNSSCVSSVLVSTLE